MSFVREGSLRKQKEEQWAREREEEAKSRWFPFGSPGGGNPNRKFESRNYDEPTRTSVQERESPRRSEEVHTRTSNGYDRIEIGKESSRGVEQLQRQIQREVVSEMTSTEKPHDASDVIYANQRILDARVAYHHPTPAAYPYMYPPVPMPSGSGGEMQNANHVPWYPYPIQYSAIPPGAVPIQYMHPYPTSPEMCPITLAENWAKQQQNNNTAHWPGVQMGIPIGAPIAVAREREIECRRTSEDYHRSTPPSTECRAQPTNVAVVSPMDSYAEATTTTSMHVEGYGEKGRRGSDMSNLVDDYAQTTRSRHQNAMYDEQVDQRRRYEQSIRDREKAEEERIQREKKQAEQREAEEEERHRRMEQARREEEERRTRSLSDALEQAKKEAEVTKKARLHRHELEADPSKVEQILGVDKEYGLRILGEIRKLERQKSNDWDALEKVTPKNNGKENSRSRSVPPKSRSASMSTAGENIHVTEKEVKEQPTVRQTASVRPFTSDDRPIRPAMVDTDYSDYAPSPLARNQKGRMSVRVTRKEIGLKEKEKTQRGKENQGFRRQSGSTTNLVEKNPEPQERRSRLGSMTASPPTSTMHQSRIPIPTHDSRRSTSTSRVAAPPPPPHRAPVVQTTAAAALRHGYAAPSSAAIARQLINDLPTADRHPRRSREPLTSNTEALLYSPISIRRVQRGERMRGLSDSPVNGGLNGGSVDSNDEGSSETRSNYSESQSPTFVIEEDVTTPEKTFVGQNNNEIKVRSVSATHSPSYFLNGSSRALSPLSSSVFARRLAERGCGKHGEDVLSPDVRRKAEADLSRSPSIQSLRGSFYNLSTLRGSTMNLNVPGRDSPDISRFKSTNPAYRSFNTKKGSDKQQEVIDRLNRLRENLRSKENFVERGGHLSKHGSNVSVLAGSPARQA